MRSHAELYSQVLALACLLGGYDIPRGAVVAASCRSSRMLMLLTHAAPMMGCALQPLNPGLPRRTAETLFARTGASHLVADVFAEEGSIQVIDAAALAAGLERLDRDFEADLPVAPLTPGEVHLIVATSGSEGEPKAAMLTRRNIAATVAASRERIGLGPEDRWLVCLPLNHIGGLAILHRCAQAGASVVLTDSFDAMSVGEVLHRQSCTHVSMVPAMLARLLNRRDPPPMLRRAEGGGTDPGWRKALARGRSRISYGMTGFGFRWRRCVTRSGIGRANWPVSRLPMQVEVDDHRAHPHTGRRCDERLHVPNRNPESADGGRLVLDGDLGRLDDDGCLWVLGRADDMLVTGASTHPLQVEAVMAGCPGITEVAAAP
jgi:O-succinylbenzoic acid--CoA ligase